MSNDKLTQLIHKNYFKKMISLVTSFFSSKSRLLNLKIFDKLQFGTSPINCESLSA